MTVGNHLFIENKTLFVEIGHFAKRLKYNWVLVGFFLKPLRFSIKMIVYVH